MSADTLGNKSPSLLCNKNLLGVITNDEGRDGDVGLRLRAIMSINIFRESLQNKFNCLRILGPSPFLMYQIKLK